MAKQAPIQNAKSSLRKSSTKKLDKPTKQTAKEPEPLEESFKISAMSAHQVDLSPRTQLQMEEEIVRELDKDDQNIMDDSGITSMLNRNADQSTLTTVALLKKIEEEVIAVPVIKSKLQRASTQEE